MSSSHPNSYSTPSSTFSSSSSPSLSSSTSSPPFPPASAPSLSPPSPPPPPPIDYSPSSLASLHELSSRALLPLLRSTSVSLAAVACDALAEALTASSDLHISSRSASHRLRGQGSVFKDDVPSQNTSGGLLSLLQNNEELLLAILFCCWRSTADATQKRPCATTPTEGLRESNFPQKRRRETERELQLLSAAAWRLLSWLLPPRTPSAVFVQSFTPLLPFIEILCLEGEAEEEDEEAKEGEEEQEKRRQQGGEEQGYEGGKSERREEPSEREKQWAAELPELRSVATKTKKKTRTIKAQVMAVLKGKCCI